MWTWLLNLLIPGAGLIIRRREWLGLSLALVFGICGNVFVAGLWIAPAAIPPAIAHGAGLVAALWWLLSQALLWRQIQHQRRCKNVVDCLIRDSREAWERGDLAAAHSFLERALRLDDECVELHVLSARVFERRGDAVQARLRWRRVLQLDQRREYQTEARRSLAVHEG